MGNIGGTPKPPKVSARDEGNKILQQRPYVNAESADELPFSLRHHNMQTFLQIWQISSSWCPLLNKQRAFISSKALHSTQLKALSPEVLQPCAFHDVVACFYSAVARQ